MANKEKEPPPLPPLLALLLAPSEEGVPGFRRSNVFNCMGLRERGAAANTCRGLSELVQHCRCTLCKLGPPSGRRQGWGREIIPTLGVILAAEGPARC